MRYGIQSGVVVPSRDSQTFAHHDIRFKSSHVLLTANDDVATLFFEAEGVQ
jgi:hypothetical protein